MSSIFGFDSPSILRDTTLILPDQPLYPPYQLRSEMNWLDFSTTSNPLGTPQSFLSAMHTSLVDGELTYEPDRDARALKAVLAARYSLPSKSFLCGSAVSSMIQAAAQTYQPCIVGVSVPSPVEYSLAVSNAGHEVMELSSSHTFVVPEASVAHKNGLEFDAAVLANPSYPTSRLLPKSTLLDYLKNCKWVIVDESLINLTFGGESMVEMTRDYRNLIVVRSLSSFYAIPGTPISFCVAHPETIKQIECFYDSSGVSMFAEVLAAAIQDEEGFIEETHELLDSEIPWMQCMLNLIPGIKIFPAEANFVMCSFDAKPPLELGVDNATELVFRLQLAGYLVKKLDGIPGILSDSYFCVAVKKREENEKLLSVMKRIILAQD